MAGDLSVARAVLDTHTLMWHTLDPDKLSSAARLAIAGCESDGGVVSAISVWEIAIKVKRGALDLSLPVMAYDKLLRELRWLEIRSVDVETWIASSELDWAHRDPVDRVIVALATTLGLPIVTKDAAIREFYRHCIW